MRRAAHLALLLSLALLPTVLVAEPAPLPKLDLTFSIAPEAQAAEAIGPFDPADTFLAATCTEGSFQYVPTGECCGAAMSRTQKQQQKCVNGQWLATGFYLCSLPICFVP